MITKLIVHDTGTDGDTTHTLIVGKDIPVDVAEDLVAKNGSTTVYSLHVYVAGKRKEQFVPKHIYDQSRSATSTIPKARTVDEIRRDMDRRLSSKPHKAWWQFWK